MFGIGFLEHSVKSSGSRGGGGRNRGGATGSLVGVGGGMKRDWEPGEGWVGEGEEG